MFLSSAYTSSEPFANTLNIEFSAAPAEIFECTHTDILYSVFVSAESLKQGALYLGVSIKILFEPPCAILLSVSILWLLLSSTEIKSFPFAESLYLPLFTVPSSNPHEAIISPDSMPSAESSLFFSSILLPHFVTSISVYPISFDFTSSELILKFF